MAKTCVTIQALAGRTTAKEAVDLIIRNIYQMKNYDLKELHFGSTPSRVRDRIKQYRHGAVRNLQHWDWKKHDIEFQPLDRRVLLPLAFIRVQTLRRKCKDDWKIV
jgi:hypothetical protein